MKRCSTSSVIATSTNGCVQSYVVGQDQAAPSDAPLPRRGHWSIEHALALGPRHAVWREPGPRARRGAENRALWRRLTFNLLARDQDTEGGSEAARARAASDPDFESEPCVSLEPQPLPVFCVDSCC